MLSKLFDTILVYPLMNILLVILAVVPGHDFGVAVIIFSILVRMALWPIFSKQLHSQKKLQELQPEIVKLKAKAKGDKQMESKLLMELYKEKEINPLSSCLPLIIQLPFLIALFSVFRHVTGDFRAVADHIYPFVKSLPFIQQLVANPLAFKPTLLSFINMTKPNVVLAVLAGLTQFVQARMIAPKPTGKRDQQAQMTMIMGLVLPVVTFVFALQFPAALALYWTVTTLVMIFQQWWTMRSETEKMEEVKLTTKVRGPQKNKAK